MQLVEASGLPYAHMPAAKGLLSEHHPQARTSPFLSFFLSFFLSCFLNFLWPVGGGRGWGRPRRAGGGLLLLLLAHQLLPPAAAAAACCYSCCCRQLLLSPTAAVANCCCRQLLLQSMGTYWGEMSSPFCAEIVESADAYIFVGESGCELLLCGAQYLPRLLAPRPSPPAHALLATHTRVHATPRPRLPHAPAGPQMNDYATAGNSLNLQDSKMVRVEEYRVVVGGAQVRAGGGGGGHAGQGGERGARRQVSEEAPGRGARQSLMASVRSLSLQALRAQTQLAAPPSPLPPRPAHQVFGCVRMDDFLGALAARVAPAPASLDAYRRLYVPPPEVPRSEEGAPLETKARARGWLGVWVGGCAGVLHAAAACLRALSPRPAHPPLTPPLTPLRCCTSTCSRYSPPTPVRRLGAPSHASLPAGGAERRPPPRPPVHPPLHHTHARSQCCWRRLGTRCLGARSCACPRGAPWSGASRRARASPLLLLLLLPAACCCCCCSAAWAAPRLHSHSPPPPTQHTLACMQAVREHWVVWCVCAAARGEGGGHAVRACASGSWGGARGGAAAAVGATAAWLTPPPPPSPQWAPRWGRRWLPRRSGGAWSRSSATAPFRCVCARVWMGGGGEGGQGRTQQRKCPPPDAPAPARCHALPCAPMHSHALPCTAMRSPAHARTRRLLPRKFPPCCATGSTPSSCCLTTGATRSRRAGGGGVHARGGEWAIVRVSAAGLPARRAPPPPAFDTARS